MRAAFAAAAGFALVACAPTPRPSPIRTPPPSSPAAALAAGDQVVDLGEGRRLIPLTAEERQQVATMAREHGSMGRCDEPQYRMVAPTGCPEELPASGPTALCYRCRNGENILVLADNAHGFVAVLGSKNPRRSKPGERRFVEVYDQDQRKSLTAMLHRAGADGKECDLVTGMLLPTKPIPGVTEATYHCQNGVWVIMFADPESGIEPRVQRLQVPPEDAK